MTFEEFTKLGDRFLLIQMQKPKEARWRRGQTYFNVLWDNRPDLANQVRGTELDPFNLDARLPGFLAWVELHWNDKEA